MMQAWLWVLLGFIAFWAAAYALGRRSSGPLRVYPLLLVYRVGYERGPIRERKKALAARAYGVLSVPLAVASAALFYYVSLTLFVGRYVVQSPAASQEGFVPLIPGVTVGLGELIYFLIAIGVAVMAHELSHAVVSRATGVPLKSAGFVLLAFIPAAFVEPEEEAMKSAPLRSKLMIYSAGVAANLALGLAFMYAISLVLPALANGVTIVGVSPSSPAYRAGLVPGMTIIAVNGAPVYTVAQGLQELIRAGAEGPGPANVTLTVYLRGVVENVTVFKPAGYNRLGISVVQSFRLPWLAGLLTSMYVVNMGLALVNAAPLAIPFPGLGVETDGGQMLREAAARLGKTWKVLASALELATLVLLLSLITIAPIHLP